MISDRGRLDHTPSTNMHKVTNLHGIVIEIASVCFVWRSELGIYHAQLQIRFSLSKSMSSPNRATLSNQAVSSKRNDHRMSGASPSEITSDDRISRYDRFSTKNDILWTRDDRSARYLVSGILMWHHVKRIKPRPSHLLTVSMYSALLYLIGGCKFILSWWMGSGTK